MPGCTICLLKNYVAEDAVKGIGKINLEEDLRLPGGRTGSRTAITSGGMDCGFTTTTYSKTKLRIGARTPPRGLSRRQRIFAANRRKVLPTAIGRIPPHFFRRVVSLPPKSTGLTAEGTMPDKIMSHRRDSASIRRTPETPMDSAVRSFKWMARIPSIPQRTHSKTRRFRL